jgi:hypothetical protein
MSETKEDKALAAARTEREKRAKAHTEAQAASKLVQDVFDTHGDAAAEKALNAARAAEQSALEHLGRAERLLARAETEAAVALRARQTAELEALEREYSATEQETKLVAAEYRAFVALVDSMMARETHHAARRTLCLKMIGLRGALGLGISELHSDIVNNLHRRSFLHVRRMLEEASVAAGDDYRRTYFIRLAQSPLDLATRHQ